MVVVEEVEDTTEEVAATEAAAAAAATVAEDTTEVAVATAMAVGGRRPRPITVAGAGRATGPGLTLQVSFSSPAVLLGDNAAFVKFNF